MKKVLIILLLFFGFLVSCSGQKISELPETTSLESTDLFVVVINAGTRKITWNNILGMIIDSTLTLFPTTGEFLTAEDLDTSDVAIPALDSATAKLLLFVWTDTTKAYRKQLTFNFKKIDSTAFFIDTVNSGFWMDGDTLKFKPTFGNVVIKSDSSISFLPGANFLLPYWDAPYIGMLGGSIGYETGGHFIFYDPTDARIEEVVTYDDAFYYDEIYSPRDYTGITQITGIQSTLVTQLLVNKIWFYADSNADAIRLQIMNDITDYPGVADLSVAQYDYSIANSDSSVIADAGILHNILTAGDGDFQAEIDISGLGNINKLYQLTIWIKLNVLDDGGGTVYQNYNRPRISLKYHLKD